MPRLPSVDTLPQPRPPQPSLSAPSYSGPQPQDIAAQGYAASAQLSDQEVKRIQADQNAQDQLDLSHATSAFLQGKVALDAMPATDANYSTYTADYNTKLNQLKDKVAGALGGDLRQKFLDQANLEAAKGSVSANDKAKKTEVDVGRATLDGVINSNLKSALGATDEGTISGLLTSSGDAVDGALGKQYVSALEAEKIKKSLPGTFAEQRAAMIVGTNPTMAEKLLKPSGTADDGAPVFGKTGTWIDFLDPAKRSALYDQAQRKIGENVAIQRGDVERRVQDGLAALDDGQPAPFLPSHAEVAAIYPKDPGKAAAVNGMIDDARQVGGYLSKLPGMSADEIEQATQALGPDSSKPGYADKAKAYTSWIKAVGAWGQQMTKDPAATVMGGNADIRAKFDAVQQDPSKFSDYANATLSLQERQGVPSGSQHVLPVANVKAITTDIENDPEKAPVKIKTLESQYGSSWNSIWRDLTTTKGGLSPSFQAVGTLDDEGQAALLARGLAEQGKTGKSLYDLLPPKSKAGLTGIDTNIEADPSVRTFLSSLSHSGASAQMQTDILGAIKTLSYANVVYAGKDPSTAASLAIEAFTGKYDFSLPGSPRVPKDIAPAVSLNARGVLSGLDGDKIAVPQLFGQQGMPKADEYLRVVKSSPTWITSPQADSLWLMDPYGRLVRDKSGNPISVPFKGATIGASQWVPEGGYERNAVTGVLRPRQ